MRRARVLLPPPSDVLRDTRRWFCRVLALALALVRGHRAVYGEGHLCALVRRIGQVQVPKALELSSKRLELGIMAVLL